MKQAEQSNEFALINADVKYLAVPFKPQSQMASIQQRKLSKQVGKVANSHHLFFSMNIKSRKKCKSAKTEPQQIQQFFISQCQSKIYGQKEDNQQDEESLIYRPSIKQSTKLEASKSTQEYLEFSFPFSPKNRPKRIFLRQNFIAERTYDEDSEL